MCSVLIGEICKYKVTAAAHTDTYALTLKHTDGQLFRNK